MNVALHPPLNVLGICAGVGGLELGLQLAHGYLGKAVRGLLYVEREAAAAASLVASMEAGWLHPAPVWSDARTFDGTAFGGLVDIVTSGDPCQGNSVAGKRLGELDDRWLLDRAIDIFDQTGAPRFFRENVPGNADGQLAVAIPALERLGCRVAVGIFSSAETGNTMRRERLFILAEREGDQRGLGARSERECLSDAGRCGCGTDGAGSGRHGDAHEAIRAGRHGAVDAGYAVGSPPKGMDGPAGSEGRPLDGSCRADRRDDVSQRQEGAVGIGEPGEGVGGPSSPEPQGQHHAAGRQVKGGYPVLSGRAVLPPAVIPGPSDSGGWRALLDRYPEYQPALSQEEAESHLRRGIDAMAHRIERLRATGNGVDPITAAVAYLSLSELLA